MSDGQTTVTPTGDGDAARYAEMAKTYADPPVETDVKSVEPAAEPVKEVKAEEKKPEPLPYEEIEKRYKNLQGALGEARGETRTIKQQMEQVAADNRRLQEFLRQIAEPKQQPEDEDPYLGPVQRQLGTLAEQQRQIAEQQRQQQEAWEAQQRSAMLAQSVSTEEQRFAEKTPDYYTAIGHLRAARAAEYAAMYPDGYANAETYAINQGFRTAADLRQALLARDVQGLAEHAYQLGINPAELAYTLAKQRGYAQKQLAPAAPAALPSAPQDRIAAIRNGQQAATSLSTGASGGPAESGFPSQAELARMYLEDPEKAEGIIARMKRAGVLA